MKETDINGNEYIEKRINELRLKLSQELDKYIFSAQQEVLGKPKKEKD